MLIGILSDTHGRVDAALTAVQMLVDHQAEYLLHCGDVGETSVLDALAGHQAAFVFGNCDFQQQALRNYAQILGIQCCDLFGDLNLDGKRIALIHGHQHTRYVQTVKSGDYDYVCTGHTHVAEDIRVGKTRLINPGALFRTSRKSVALLDTEKDELTLLYPPL